ncbi:hypothetical protein D9619_007678 [Psilocybe cf. subviscida]|uniref:Uncharacterized protein n=1 Tax=Psilocybe cf. subviscida TaxID=2480587 RepID=A0A8H5AUG5_9AGAR|nr:hypothetical protein D9619_007678 [Psilocybe cf. subviscida]
MFSLFSSQSPEALRTTPIQINVQTRVESDNGDPSRLREAMGSHGSTNTSGTPGHTAFSTTSTTSAPWTRMALPRSNYDPRRVCLNPFPEITLGKHRRTVGVYLAGALFALANWTFLDAAILSAHAKAPFGAPPGTEAPVHVTFVDWIPGFCSLLGYLVVNLIDKDRIRGDEGFGDSRAVWRARLFLFIGFALMAGGLAGSATVLVLKYVLSGYPQQFAYYGYANVSQSVALMLSAIVLWIAQNTSSEYEYNLTL